MDPRWTAYFEGQRQRARQTVPDPVLRQQFLDEIDAQERQAQSGRLRYPEATPEERAAARALEDAVAASPAQPRTPGQPAEQDRPPIPVQSVVPFPAPLPQNLPQLPDATPVSQSSFIQEVLKPLNANFRILDNELNKFDRYAYHLKLSMIGDFDANNENIAQNIAAGKNYSSIIIAESGVTVGFNIVDCEIRDALSSNFRSRTSITTEISLTIVEPYSLTLADKLYLAGLELKVQNWRMAPMILEVWFRGYNEVGIPQDTKDSQNIYKIYKLIFSDFTSTLTETGTTYKITALADGNLGFSNQFFILPLGFTYDSSRPVADRLQSVQPRDGAARLVEFGPKSIAAFFKQLQDALNNFYQTSRFPPQQQPGQERPTAQLPLVIYRFYIMDEELAAKDIDFSPQAYSRRLSFVSSGGQQGSITVSRGTSITNIIDDVMSSLADDKYFFVDGVDGQIRVPTVESRVVNVGWDGILNDYVREITYFINVRKTYRPVPSPAFNDAFQFPEIALERVKQQAPLVKKAYTYYYTGNNTEVLSLNVEFNNLHILPIPFGGDQTLPPALLGSVQQASAQGLASLRQALAQAQARVSSARQALQQAEAAVPPAGEGGAAGAAELLRRQREAQLRAAVQDFDASAQALQTIQQRGIAALVRGAISDPQGNIIDAEAQTYVDNLRGEALNNPRFRGFAEDLLRSVAQQSPGRLTYFADAVDIVNHWTRTVGGNPDRQARITYASIISQMYDRLGDSMTEIDIEIKGDPYWMGVTNFEREMMLNKVRAPAVPSGESTPVSGGPAVEPIAENILNRFDSDSMFMIIFRAGAKPNETTGYIDLDKTVEWFHALYIGIEVTHIFRDGKFTQKLHAVREPINNLVARGASPVVQPPVEQPPIGGVAPRAPREQPPIGGVAPVSPIPPGGAVVQGVDQ